jgi:two-component system OmpR family sensor kinase
VRGDPDQLRQVLGNLIGNALAHTGGTPIGVSVGATEHGVQLEVRDHGPGLPTEVSDEVFERFWRSDPGRGRGRAGAGLGLAIVAGIVSSHGGRVHAENVPDGARFTVWLPAAASRAPGPP